MNMKNATLITRRCRGNTYGARISGLASLELSVRLQGRYLLVWWWKADADGLGVAGVKVYVERCEMHGGRDFAASSQPQGRLVEVRISSITSFVVVNRTMTSRVVA